MARVSRAGQLRAGRAGRRAGLRATSPGSRPYEVDPFDVPDADKVGAARRLVRAAARRRRRRPRRRRSAAGAGEQVLRRHRRHDDHPAAGPAAPGARGRPRSTASRRHVRDDAHLRAAGRPRLGVPHRRRLGLGRRARPSCPSWLAEKAKAPSVEPGRYDLVIDPSNLWLTIHESIGHATELDRALGYEAAYAGTSFATFDQLGTPAVRLAGDERHRRPDRRARPGHRSATTTRASPRSSGT